MGKITIEIIILIALVTFTSCGFINNVRSFVTKIMVGDPVGQLSPDVTPTTPGNLPQGPKVIPVSTKETVYNLLSSLTNTPDESIANIIATQIETNKSLFQEKDDILIGHFEGFMDLLEAERIDVAKYLFLIYSKLEGENQHELGKVLATGLDHMPAKFIELYFLQFNDETCKIGSFIPNPLVDNDEPYKQYYALQERKEKLQSINTSAAPSDLQYRLKTFISNCVREIDISLSKMNAGQ